MKNLNPKKLVCVFAHPDDEAFGPAGSIAHFVNNGVEVHIISVTSGDADLKFTKFVKHKKLGSIREKELEASAKILGVKSVKFLHFKDGSLNNNSYHEVAKALTKLLKDLKPDTLMTFAQNGVSGHLDHIAVSMISSYVFERLGFIKNILYYCERKEIKEKIGKKYFVYFPEGYSRREIDLIIDVKKYIPLKKKAMWAHKSQRVDATMIMTLFLMKYGREESFIVKRK